MRLNNESDVILTNLFGIGVMMAFLLPHSSTTLFMVNPILCLIYQLFKQNKYRLKLNLIVIVPLLCSLLYNLPQNLSGKSILSTLAILLYFFYFPIVGKIKLNNFYIYATLFVILLSQITYLLGIPILESLLDKFYPIPSLYENEYTYIQNHATTATMFDYRFGGLYRNSNDCARSLTMLMAAYLIFNHHSKNVKLFGFTSISFFAILLTGSRTGFFIGSILIVAYLFVSHKKNRGGQLIIIATTAIGLLYMFIKGSEVIRSLNVVQGFSDSASYKFLTFKYYITTESSPLRLLLGYVDSTRFNPLSLNENVMKKFDSDYGYIIFCYGIIGFLSIATYFFILYKRMTKVGRIYFILLFWMISNTVITSYRGLFIFLLLLSPIICENYKLFPNTKS